MLNRLAQQLAGEIQQHDWSDAPYRADRAGHDRQSDSAKRSTDQLSEQQTEILKLNVMWVTAQVLAYNDPNFDVREFAAACGCRENRTGILKAGLRGGAGQYQRPGTFEFDNPGTTMGSPDGTTGRMLVSIPLDDNTTWADLRSFVSKADEDNHEKLWFEYDEDFRVVNGIKAHLRTT